jgi:hypothetical protein
MTDATHSETKSPPEQPILVPVKDAGRIVAGWNQSATYEAVRTGRFPLPIVKVGKRSYVRTADIDALAKGDWSHTSATHVAESA